MTSIGSSKPSKASPRKSCNFWRNFIKQFTTTGYTLAGRTLSLEARVQDPRTLSKFLKAVGAQFVCEVCRRSTWTMAQPDSGLAVALPIQKDMVSEVASVVPAYLLICRHCGNTRFHAMAMVEPESFAASQRAAAVLSRVSERGRG